MVRKVVEAFRSIALRAVTSAAFSRTETTSAAKESQWMASVVSGLEKKRKEYVAVGQKDLLAASKFPFSTDIAQASSITSFAGNALAIAPQDSQDEKKKTKAKAQECSKYTVEIRDYVQSSIEGVIDMSPRGHVMQYISTVNELYHSGAPIKSIVAFGGTWYQLFAMHDINPFDVFRNVIDATPAKPGQKALPIELLQRSSHQFGLEEVSQDVIRETYRELAEIAGPDREIIIRLFHFNNRDMHKDSTYAAIKELRDQGISNFIISDEHSYAIFMKNEEVAEGIITGLLRNVEMTSGDASYPLQGGIKDFSGSLAPQDAEAILRYTHQRIQEEVAKLVLQGNTVDAERLQKSTITLHSHLTDKSKDTADVFEQVGKELGTTVTTHRIHNVENATHHVISDEGLTEAQLVLQRKAEGILANIVQDNNAKVVKDYKPGEARPWTGFAGGGTPMIQGFINRMAKESKPQDKQKEPVTEAEKKAAKERLYRHMEAVRDDNNISTVTPAQKGVADIAKMRADNEQSGRPLYDGILTSEAVDVVRNLLPERVKHKDLLELSYRQFRGKILSIYEEEKSISPELKAALLQVGMNSDKSSLDKEKTQAVLAEFAAKGEKVSLLVQDEIIEACGHATRATRFPDQIANAQKLVAEINARNAAKKPEERPRAIPERQKELLVATLVGGRIGATFVEHHGHPQHFPSLGVTAKPTVYRPILAELWAGHNVAGDVLPEVMERRPVSEVTKADQVTTVKEAPQRKVG